MNSKALALTTKLLVCLTATSALPTSPAHARTADLTVSVAVSGAGLHLSDPADARTYYSRLRTAALIACGPGDRVGLKPVADFQGCFDKAVGEAVRAVNRPLVTALYLSTHTVQEAAARGIAIPARMAVR